MRTLGMVFGGVALVATACSVKDPLYCRSDFDCQNFADRPRCDLTGDHEENHLAHTCVANWDPDAGLPDAPADAPVDATRVCAPSSVTCANDVLSTCSADGTSKLDTPCALGCYTDGTRCYDLDPSNALAAQLDDSVGGPDVVLSDGAVINMKTGEVTNGDGSSIAIPSEVVVQAQVDAPKIRVFKVRSMVVGDISVISGEGAGVVAWPPALAFVSSGNVLIQGHFDVSATRDMPGPGASSKAGGTVARPCEAGWATYSTRQSGSGGGGFLTAGGSGGANALAGGVGGLEDGAGTGEPIRGGCSGGFRLDDGFRAAGGGALQIASRTRIDVTGIVDAGGGGGTYRAGGGSGGEVLLEAPVISIVGTNAGVVANGGGGGGGCNPSDGADGSLTLLPSAGGTCSATGFTNGGNGGAGNVPPTNGVTYSGTANPSGAGGGGGAAGRIWMNTAAGTATRQGNVVVGQASEGLVRRR
ncbi:MAG: hypothetical protein K8W52_31100 [Deltaproteobacteria bacterium]|nr:hypothetical protein [Deltaproteobacteria bacterium]